MADYCLDCSATLFGEDDDAASFAGMISRLVVAEGYGLLAHCDECGPLLVDQDGRRIVAQGWDG